MEVNRMTIKPKLSASQQVAHMVDLGIGFKIISKEEAEQYILDNTYFFKIKSFAKNYNKNSINQYVDLEFAYLKELSILDMHLRNLILMLCLHLEHFLKVDLNKHLCQNNAENGYTIIETFQKSAFYTNNGGFQLKTKSRYNEDLISKYENCFALWNFMEIISFGELIHLYKFYFEKYDVKKAKLFIFLFSVKQLRNACAHNNCLLNNINKPVAKTNYSLISFLKNKSSLSKTTIETNCNKLLGNDFASLLYCFFNIVSSKDVKNHVKVDLNNFAIRLQKNKDLFSKNDRILSMLNFLESIIDFFDRNY